MDLKGHAMTQKPNKPNKHAATAGGMMSRTHSAAATCAKRRATPTSERIIKQTSVKRRKAMQVLANR